MATIILFASSLSIVSILVLIKAIELKFGKKNIILVSMSQLDNKILSLVSGIKFRSLQLVQSIRYIILVQSKELIRESVDKIQLKIVNEYEARQRLIMGRKSIANKGSVSFYLKKIAEERGNGGRGKIEESLIEN